MFLLALSATMFVAHSMGKYTEYLFPAEHPRQMGFKSSAMQVMQIGPLALQSHGVTPVFDPTYAVSTRFASGGTTNDCDHRNEKGRLSYQNTLLHLISSKALG